MTDEENMRRREIAAGYAHLDLIAERARSVDTVEEPHRNLDDVDTIVCGAATAIIAICLLAILYGIL